jgi:hypothetical protein
MDGSEREEPARLLVDGRRLGSGKPLPFNVAVGGSDLDRPRGSCARTASAVETRQVTRRQRSALNARVSEPRTFARGGRKSRPKRALLPLKHKARRSTRDSFSSAGRQPHRARVLVFDNVGCRVRPNASLELKARSKDHRHSSIAPTGTEVPSTGHRGASRVNGHVVNPSASRGQPSGGFKVASRKHAAFWHERRRSGSCAASSLNGSV